MIKPFKDISGNPQGSKAIKLIINYHGKEIEGIPGVVFNSKFGPVHSVCYAILQIISNSSIIPKNNSIVNAEGEYKDSIKLKGFLGWRPKLDYKLDEVSKFETIKDLLKSRKKYVHH